MDTRSNRLAEAVLTSSIVYVWVEIWKKYQSFYLKIFTLFGSEIFYIFEYACFRIHDVGKEQKRVTNLWKITEQLNGRETPKNMSKLSFLQVNAYPEFDRKVL